MSQDKQVREGIRKFASEAGVEEESTSDFVQLVEGQVKQAAVAHRMGAGRDLVKDASLEDLSELDKLIVKSAGEITNDEMEKMAEQGLLEQILEGLQSAGGRAGEAMQTPGGLAAGGATVGGLGGAGLAKILGLPMAPSVGVGSALGAGIGPESPEIAEAIKNLLSQSEPGPRPEVENP